LYSPWTDTELLLVLKLMHAMECIADCSLTMRFRVILKRAAIVTSAVVGGTYLGVWALPKLQKDEVHTFHVRLDYTV